MISTFTRTARRLRSTLDNIATPCSVNAYGNVRRPPHELEVTICDLKFETSRFVNRNMKSDGKRRGIPLDSLNERLRRHAVKRRDVAIENHLLSARPDDQPK